MERVRSQSGLREEEAGAACVVCDAALEGSRCVHCGAAVAPGGYRVLRLISQSPHGRVYLAVDARGAKVALKELLFSLVPGVEQLDAFEREAAVLRSLQHPDIPRFVASFKEGSGVGTRLYLAQELLEGESLLQRLARRRLDEEEAWTLAEQVLRTLQSLHQRTPVLVHRDVKPANLILRPDGSAALVDFGAARHLSRDMTHGSTLVGTFGYMPPEQLGGTVEPSSDLYALGATLVHALSGREPADLVDEGLALSFEHHLQVSDGLQAFLRRLLAPKRSARFSSAVEALSALRATRVAREAKEAARTSRADGSGRAAADVVASPEARAAEAEARAAGDEARAAEAEARAAEAESRAAGDEARAAEAEAPGVAPREPIARVAGLDGAMRPSVEVAGSSEAQIRSSEAEAAREEAKHPQVSAHRKKLRWAFVALSATALLIGVLRLLGTHGASAVVMDDSPDWGSPTPQPPASRPASPPGGGEHRNFRTPWPGGAGSR